MAEESEKKSGGYGKRPVWQWVLLYLIIAAVVYFGIYYIYTHWSGSGSGYGGSSTTQNSPY